MMYLSKGELTQSSKTGLDYVSRCGCAYALGPELSAPVIKCKKTPRKKCSFVAEEAKKR